MEYSRFGDIPESLRKRNRDTGRLLLHQHTCIPIHFPLILLYVVVYNIVCVCISGSVGNLSPPLCVFVNACLLWLPSFLVSYALTYKLCLARLFSLVYILMCVCADMHMRFSEYEVLSTIPLFADLLPFERVRVLQRFYPCVCVLFCALATLIHASHNEDMIWLLTAIESTTQQFISKLQTAIDITGDSRGRDVGVVPVRSVSDRLQLVTHGKMAIGSTKCDDRGIVFGELLMSLSPSQRCMLKDLFTKKIDDIIKTRKTSSTGVVQHTSKSDTKVTNTTITTSTKQPLNIDTTDNCTNTTTAQGGSTQGGNTRRNKGKSR
eukprot:GHVR01180881.1.p1 GENE.GHVR01180881.1~~GHVR01180881.1.p1  ORF type:complete len:321 (+),score=47.27 GHVR01180881.1:512-1474(+)